MSRLPTSALAHARTQVERVAKRWLSHDRLRAYIAHDALALCWIRGRFNPKIVAKAVIPFQASAEADDRVGAAITALTAWLSSNRHEGAIEWILGFDYVQYFMLPWDERLTSDMFCQSLVRALSAQQRNVEDAGLKPAVVRFASLVHGRPRIAAAIPGTTIQALISSTPNRRWHTTNITPALAVVWDAHLDLFRKNKGTFALFEGPRMQRVSYESGQIADLIVRPFLRSDDQRYSDGLDFHFPPDRALMLTSQAIQLPGMAADDDQRLAFAICGAR